MLKSIIKPWTRIRMAFVVQPNSSPRTTFAEMAPTSNTGKIVVVMVPFPAQGHLHSMLQLARRILSYSHDIPIHYVSSPSHIRQAQSRVHGSWEPLTTPNLHFSAFDIPDFENPPPDPNDHFPSHQLPSIHAVLELRQPVAQLINNLSSANEIRKVVVVYDLVMTYVVQDVVSLPNVDIYWFHPYAALFVLTNVFKENINNIYPTGLSLDAQALLEEALFLKGLDPTPAFKEFEKKITSCWVECPRHIFTSCRSIEGVFMDLILQQVSKSYAGFKTWNLGLFINPLEAETIQCNKTTKDRHRLLQWLDKQEPNSVILISFGSSVTFPEEQISEMAIGLEQSQQKFIWVLRDADRGDVFAGKGRSIHLPEGFENRVQGRGIIESGWAPQLDILGHPSTGGFMSHCGWNSCLESISMGVPIAAWPMHTDQPANALFITKALKVGIFAREWASRNELVKAETIKNVVKTLMASPEGENLRKNAAELKDAVKASFMEGGSTQKDIEAFMSYITS